MTQSVCDFLRERIKAFIALKNESLRWFSRQVKVDYSTVYRITTGEQKGISFTNALKILKLSDPDNYLQILVDYFPQETAELNGKVSGLSQYELMVQKLADDVELYKVLVFAETQGVTRDRVREEFGRNGLKHLDSLISFGILRETPEGLVSSIEGRLMPESEDGLKKISKHHFDMVSLDTPGVYLENTRAALSKDGLKRLYYESKEYREKVMQIVKEHQGNIPAIMSVVVGPVALGEV